MTSKEIIKELRKEIDKVIQTGKSLRSYRIYQYLDMLENDNPTLSECIKEWEADYGVIQNNEYYLETIDEWDVRILIDKKTKRYQCYSVSDDIRRLETPMFVERDAHNLIHKTLKALEVEENVLV